MEGINSSVFSMRDPQQHLSKQTLVGDNHELTSLWGWLEQQFYKEPMPAILPYGSSSLGQMTQHTETKKSRDIFWEEMTNKNEDRSHRKDSNSGARTRVHLLKHSTHSPPETAASSTQPYSLKILAPASLPLFPKTTPVITLSNFSSMKTILPIPFPFSSSASLPPIILFFIL